MNTANKHRGNTVLHTQRRSGGFTIIEVMLFLGVSSVLFIVLMVGVGTTINQQRYRDSVESFAGTMQTQFFKVSNILNDRNDNWDCNSSLVEVDIDSGSPRGTTRCVVLGRYIHTTESATAVEMGYVIGTEPTEDVVIDSDDAAFEAYQPRASEFNQEVYAPEWGARLRAEDGSASSFTILIVRSPLSGLIRTYATASPMVPELEVMMTADAARRAITTCLTSDDWVVGPQRAVTIDAATSGPSGVTTSGDSAAC